jgi:hypothetical protein
MLGKTEGSAVAQMWMEKMLEANIVPGVEAVTALIDSYGNVGDIEKVEKLVAKANALRILPDHKFYGCVLKAYSYANAEKQASASHLEKAESLLMKVLAERGSVSPNTSMINSMLLICRNADRPDRAKYWLNKMKHLGLDVNTYTLGALNHWIEVAHEEEEVRKYLKHAAADGAATHTEHLDAAAAKNIAFAEVDDEYDDR